MSLYSVLADQRPPASLCPSFLAVRQQCRRQRTDMREAGDKSKGLDWMVGWGGRWKHDSVSALWPCPLSTGLRASRKRLTECALPAAPGCSLVTSPCLRRPTRSGHGGCGARATPPRTAGRPPRHVGRGWALHVNWHSTCGLLSLVISHGDATEREE